MKKILLIEDVLSRQRSFMKERNFTLDSYSDILDNAIKEEYEKVYLSLKEDTFDFDKYSIIMAHQSAFSGDVGVIVDTLKSYCKKYKKTLIFFRGEGFNYYDNSNYEYLELNTKDFYSDNLKFFLDEYRKNTHNILMLSYGQKWIVNTLLNILEKTNLFLDKNSDDDIVYDTFENFTELNKIENINDKLYKLTVDDGWVYREEIVKFRDTLLAYIKKIADK